MYIPMLMCSSPKPEVVHKTPDFERLTLGKRLLVTIPVPAQGLPCSICPQPASPPGHLNHENCEPAVNIDESLAVTLGRHAERAARHVHHQEPHL